MELIDFSKNKDSFEEIKNIESILLWGDPNAIPDAEITICIPTYKRPKLLKEAIESAIKQDTNIPYRIIVVDNDENFDNNEILKIIKIFNDKKICYYKNIKNIGMYGNWNRCGELATTNWFGLLHDDDLLKSNYIEEVYYILKKYRKYNIGALCFYPEQLNYPFNKNKKGYNRNYRIVNIILKPLAKYYSRILLKIPIVCNMLFGNVYGAPTCGNIFNRELFIESGGFNQYFSPSSDWFFYIYFSHRNNVYKYKKSFGIYRWEENESLKEETLEKFKIDREKCILSLKEQFMLCKIYFNIFKKDFINISRTRLEATVNFSIIFKIIRRLYSLKIF